MEMPVWWKDKNKYNGEIIADRLFKAAAIVASASLILCTKGDLKSLDFILRPVSTLIYMITGAGYQYIESVGYTFQGLGINIGASCSGLNFLTMLFLMLVYSFIPRQRGINGKLTAFVAFSVLAYCISIIANASRILLSALVLTRTPLAFAGQDQLVHMSIGVMVYFSYLLLAYTLSNSILQKKGASTHEISL